MDVQIPLSHEDSAGDTHKRETTSLPEDVVRCLTNARFLHLATCTDNRPQVSLMSYTYLATSPFSSSAPVVIMTTNPSSRKANNLVANPHVSLLVHDWVSPRPPTIADGGSPPPSGLAALLFNLNTSARSSISATISGTARLAEPGSTEERFYRDRHLENNTFRPGSGPVSGHADGGADPAATTASASVVVVRIEQVRISDWKGAVRDCELVSKDLNGV